MPVLHCIITGLSFGVKIGVLSQEMLREAKLQTQHNNNSYMPLNTHMSIVQQFNRLLKGLGQCNYLVMMSCISRRWSGELTPFMLYPQVWQALQPRLPDLRAALW